jgi:hypothetical protein
MAVALERPPRRAQNTELWLPADCCLAASGQAEGEHLAGQLWLVVPPAEQGTKVRAVMPDLVGVTECLAAEFRPCRHHRPILPQQKACEEQLRNGSVTANHGQ